MRTGAGVTEISFQFEMRRNQEPLPAIESRQFGVTSVFSASLVPSSHDTVYLVEDDFGAKLGRVYRETDATQCDRDTTLHDLYSGQYNNPVRVVAFNTSEGWSRDVSYEFAAELQRLADIERTELIGNVAEFVEYYTRASRQLSLRLA